MYRMYLLLICLSFLSKGFSLVLLLYYGSDIPVLPVLFSGYAFGLAAVMMICHLYRKLTAVLLLIYFSLEFLFGIASKVSVVLHPTFAFGQHAFYERILLGGYYVDDVISIICVGLLIRHINRKRDYQST
ncbi:hypothetical protein JCM19046_1415 [Bacillus sp. JCM 19046]|nr:hypothetical protein JCM19045_590 [Bacillus sp. JCM 19045]GAF16948.1 hypothetical protein JCM19046_1415 [Bacillus sp. JCM 19046]